MLGGILEGFSEVATCELLIEHRVEISQPSVHYNSVHHPADEIRLVVANQD